MKAKMILAKQTLLGLWSFQFLTFMRRGVFYSFMYIYLFSLMGNVTTTATLGTFTMLMSALGQNLLWGKISDRYRLRAQLIVLGELVAAFVYVLVFLVHKFFIDTAANTAAGLALIVGLAVLEFFWSMSDVGWAALVTDITIPETRGSFVGVVNFIMSIGRMTGVIMAGYLYEGGLGFRQGTIFYVVTFTLLTGAIVMWSVSRSLKTTSAPLFSDSKREEKGSSTNTRSETGDNSHRGKRTFLWFLVALTVIVLGAASINQIFLLFLKLEQGLHASDLEVSFILSAWTLGSITASLVVGRLTDKIGRVAIIMAGLLIAALTPLFYGIVPNVPTMAIVYGINGVSFISLQTAAFALAGDIIPPDRRGRLFSRYNAVMALSWGPAGLLIGGPLADIQTEVLGVSTQTAYINAFTVSSALILIGASLFLAKVKKQAQERHS